MGRVVEAVGWRERERERERDACWSSFSITADQICIFSSTGLSETRIVAVRVKKTALKETRLRGKVTLDVMNVCLPD